MKKKFSLSNYKKWIPNGEDIKNMSKNQRNIWIKLILSENNILEGVLEYSKLCWPQGVFFYHDDVIDIREIKEYKLNNL